MQLFSITMVSEGHPFPSGHGGGCHQDRLRGEDSHGCGLV
jgi:hypothetical protein